MSCDLINDSINLSNVNTAKKYVSVIIPSENDCLVDEGSEKPSIKDLVFESQKDALKVLKKYKNSRFKMFDNYDDAFNYSLEYSFQDEKSFIKQDSDFNVALENDSFKSCFKKPTITDLADFRKKIQKNEHDSIRQLISNPRYLINSCETPVLLMEGPRYNAFHIACKANRFNILQLILDLLKDKFYMKSLFHLDDDSAIQSRIEHIIDLYLNTPDKGLHDTPLHLACKFGCYECVEVLLSEPQCMRDMRNKNDKKASEVICDRNGDQETKKRIKNLFYSNYYISITRKDETVIVGEPQNFKPKLNLPHLSAVAGPMPKNLAIDLYERLKCPRSRSKEEVAIRLSDDSRGIERIARMQCKQNSIGWKEYWPFLGDYVDLSLNKGLKKLEDHLITISFSKADFVNCSDLEEICNKLENLDFKDLKTEVFYTAPSTPIEDEVYLGGNKISDLDIDVALALQDTPIDEIEFPHVVKWLDLVSNYIRDSKKTKVTVALSLPNLNLSFNNSFQNSFSGDSIMQHNKSVMLKCITSPSKLIHSYLI